MTGSEIVLKNTGEVATESSINEYLLRIVAKLPAPEDGDMTGILAQIINAEDVLDLDSPWQSAGMGKYNGHAIEIRNIKVLESNYPGGLGWYLLCEGIVLETGEYKAFSTSSASVMAQLLVAWDRSMFPLKVYVRIATKASKNGFYPMHLEIYRGGALVDIEEPVAAAPRPRGSQLPNRPMAARRAAAEQAAADINSAAEETAQVHR